MNPAANGTDAPEPEPPPVAVGQASVTLTPAEMAEIVKINPLRFVMPAVPVNPANCTARPMTYPVVWAQSTTIEPDPAEQEIAPAPVPTFKAVGDAV